MTDVLLSRINNTVNGMFGNLVFGSRQVAVTVERPWKNNSPRISCIPAGIYQCVAFSSPKNGSTWLLQGVPDRDMIEIHAANMASQLEGCIAPGKRFGEFDGVPGVTFSKMTMEILRNTLPPTFTLTITDPT